MNPETICWKCDEPYKNLLSQCPHCNATNANHNLDKAQAEMVAALEDSGEPES